MTGMLGLDEMRDLLHQANWKSWSHEDFPGTQCNYV